MADSYYVVYEQGAWKLMIPESARRGGNYVLKRFDTKAAAMDRARQVARNQSARLVENAKAGYTMSHYDYSAD